MSNVKDTLHYDIRSILSYRAKITMIVSSRGFGKTTSGIDWCISDWSKNHNKKPCNFIWMRRHPSELKDLDTFFKNVKDWWPQYDLKVDGRRAYISPAGEDKWEVFGYFVALSEAVTKKGVAYPDVNKIFYDEFIIDKDKQRYRHYLNNEHRELLDFMNTVNRDRLENFARCIMLANAGDIVNPHFLFWRFNDLSIEIQRRKSGDVLLQVCDASEFMAHMRQTPMGRLISGTGYDDFAIDNQFIDGGDEFIAQKPRHAKFQYSVTYKNHRFSVWCDHNDGDYYLQQKLPKKATPMFTLTRRDHRPNLKMINQSSPLLKKLVELWTYGYVYFDQAQTREHMMEAFKMCGIK